MASIIGINELIQLQEFYELEIDENCENATLTLEDGSLTITIPNEYPEKTPSIDPYFEDFDNSVIKTFLESVAESYIGGEMFKILFAELENVILPDLRKDKINSIKAREEKEKGKEVQNDRDVNNKDGSKSVKNVKSFRQRNLPSDENQKQKLKVNFYKLF